MSTSQINPAQAEGRSVSAPTDINAIICVYAVTDGEWRGFVYPYGETTEADSKKEAIEKIRDLAEAYAKTAEQYGNPPHLVMSGLMEDSDKEVAYQVIGNKEYMNLLHSEKGVADLDPYYAEAYRI